MRLSALALLLIVGCAHAESRRENLQPLVAVAGHYGVLEAAADPSPAPLSAGCEKACKCNGTGQEKSGDGISVVSCRCPETCSCKAKATACTTGSCGWPPRSILR